MASSRKRQIRNVGVTPKYRFHRRGCTHATDCADSPGPEHISLVRSNRRRRQKLVNAIFYHAELAVDLLEKQRSNNAAIEEKIRNDASYTPYVPVSTIDDLTYNQIIEVMEWLDWEGEKIVSSYFHSQMTLHASMQSFRSEYVRSWPSHRKLELWKFCEEAQKETLHYAIETRNLLDELRFRTRTNRHGPRSAHWSRAAQG